MASRQQNSDLPEEIVIEILRSLPIESLLRFRCVSKLWRSIISNPKFTLCYPSQRHLCSVSDTTYYSLNCQDALSSDPRPLNPTFFDKVDKDKKQEWLRYHFKILGSCNGLLLVLYYADLYLWNPAIRQCAKVLSIQMDSKVLPMCDCVLEPASGLCYDSYSDDYKAVTVGCNGSVSVISFRRNKWDKMNCIPVNADYGERVISGPVVNDKLHWLIVGYVNHNNNHYITPNRIVYFDPLTDEFVGLPMPPVPKNGKHNTSILGLGDLEGCLCMARHVCEKGDEVDEPRYLFDEPDFTDEVELDEVKPIFIEVLVMKEHGVGDSWTKYFIVSNDFGILRNPYCWSLVPLCFTKDGEVLFSVNGYQLLVYNPDEMTKRDIPLTRNQRGGYRASYVESLVSPSAYGHEEDWIMQGPEAWYFFFCWNADSENNSIEEEDTSYGYCSDKESFYSTKEDSSFEEDGNSYGYCSDEESFYSTKEDSSIEEEGNCVF